MCEKEGNKCRAVAFQYKTCCLFWTGRRAARGLVGRGADFEEGGKAQLRTHGHAASPTGVELGSVPEEAQAGRAEPKRDDGASGGSSDEDEDGLPMFAQSLWAALRTGRIALPAGSAPGGAPARHGAAAAPELVRQRAHKSRQQCYCRPM